MAALFVGTDAFTLPSRPCARVYHKGVAPVMVETSVIIGAVGLVGGTALGAGLISFIEGQGKRTNERGGMSDETKSRMAGMFMEDEELVSDLTDTITKMEAALAEYEGRDVVEGDGLTDEEKENLKVKGWGDD